MTKIRHRSPILINLMENVIAEELDNVPISSFGPTGIMIESIVFVSSAPVHSTDVRDEGRSWERENEGGRRTRVVR